MFNTICKKPYVPEFKRFYAIKKSGQNDHTSFLVVLNDRGRSQYVSLVNLFMHMLRFETERLF